MPAIYITQAAAGIVISPEEESCVTALISIFVEQVIHGTQEPPRVLECRRVLTAQIGLKIRHHESA